MNNIQGIISSTRTFMDTKLSPDMHVINPGNKIIYFSECFVFSFSNCNI